jgi:ATP-binding cassette subfamily B multidrug efflux pump
MSADDKSEILKSYTLIDKASSDYEKYLKDYPQLGKEPVYVLNKIDQKEINKINPLMGKAFLAVSGIEQIIADPSKAAAVGSKLGFDLSKIPAGMTSDQIFAMLAKLPADQLLKISTAVDKQFEAIGEKMITQMAVGS